MKSCPACNRTYSDNATTFCLVDGAILSAPYDPETTLHMPGSRARVPSPAYILSPDIPSEHKPSGLNPKQKPITNLELIILALLFVAASVFGGITAQLRVANAGVHYEAIIALVMLVLVSLLLVIARKRASLTQQIGIYLIKTLCLWGGFAFGWIIVHESTPSMAPARFLFVLSGWWIVSVFIGTLLSAGLYMLYKRTTKSSATRA